MMEELVKAMALGITEKLSKENEKLFYKGILVLSANNFFIGCLFWMSH